MRYAFCKHFDCWIFLASNYNAWKNSVKFTPWNLYRTRPWPTLSIFVCAKISRSKLTFFLTPLYRALPYNLNRIYFFILSFPHLLLLFFLSTPKNCKNCEFSIFEEKSLKVDEFWLSIIYHKILKPSIKGVIINTCDVYMNLLLSFLWYELV